MINEKLEDLLKEQTKSYILCKKLGICDRLLRKYINGKISIIIKTTGD